MPPMDPEQARIMRWALFWIIVTLYVVIVLATLSTLFLEFGNLTTQERGTLFTVFLVEIGVAVFALFYAIFGLRKQEQTPRLRLNFDDVEKLKGQTAILSPSRSNGESLKDIEARILDDNGPYLPLNLPSTAHGVFIRVPTAEREYTGSFVVGTYLVDID